jgi:hypothetical protein
MKRVNPATLALSLCFGASLADGQGLRENAEQPAAPSKPVWKLAIPSFASTPSMRSV